MSQEFQQKAIIAALQSRIGAPSDFKEQMQKFNEAQSDWFAYCPICKTKIKGTMAEIKAHKHGDTSPSH